MKSKLLFTTVVFAGLSGIISAQSFGQQQPGNSGYVTPNMVTPGQLTQWMQASIGSSMATADQWCYAMGQLVTGGYTCPHPEDFGFTGELRYEPVDARTFLNNLQAYGYTGPYSTGG
jgi:hypothetical protein